MSTNELNQNDLDPKDTESAFDSLAENWLLEENKELVNLVQSFSVHFRSELSQYLGKHVDIEFQQIECLQEKNKLQNIQDSVYIIFALEERVEQGLILFDFQSISFFIDYLYGYTGNEKNEEFFSFGHCSLKVVEQIGNLFLNDLRLFFSNKIQFEPRLIKSTLYLKDLGFLNTEEKSYKIVFKMITNNLNCSFSLILPQNILEELVFNSQVSKIKTEGTHTVEEASLKKEVIDSTVTVTAFLPEIKLPLNKVVDLKPGDLIEISDPSLVELRIDNKKVSKAQLGQLNSYKVVKMIESIKK